MKQSDPIINEMVKSIDYNWDMCNVDLNFITRRLEERSTKEVDYKNSGTEIVFNATGSDIETRINELLLEMENYRKSSAEINKEISLSGYATHKVKTNDEHGNWVRKADIKGSVICIWHAYKNELKTLLKEYFRIKLNPEFKFDVNILEQLNFRACQHCCESSI